MRGSVLLLLTLGGLIQASPSEAQGPPPAAILPDDLREPVNGYSMQVPFQRWRMRVERQKGDAIRDALAAPPIVEGERQIGRTFLTFAYSWDLGVTRRGEIRTFCPTRADWSFEAGSCHYIYRHGSVPAQAAVYGERDNPVARWMRENFDKDRVAAALGAAGIAPGQDLWRVDEQTMLDGHPSAIPMLLENVELVTVDSRTCPGLRDAVRTLDRSRIESRTDILAVGDDQPSRPPRPHAVTGSYTLEFYTGQGFMTLSGESEALWTAVSPSIKAAEACAAR